MAEATLQVQIREKKGKQAAKHMRNEGFVPGVLYGPGKEPFLLTIDYKELFNLLHSFGRNAVVNIVPEGGKKKIKAFIYEIQSEPLSGNIIHIDFKHISLKEKIHVTVPIYLEGIPEGVKNEGGMIDQAMHALEIVCFPADIPENIKLDVSPLCIGDIIHVRDIEKKNFEFISDPDNNVVHVIAPKIVLAEELEEVLEGEEAEELEEPEVIGQKEEERE